MINYLKKSYLQSGLGVIILTVTSLLLLIASIVYQIIDFGTLKIIDEGNKTLVFLMFLIGGIVGLVIPLFHIKVVEDILPLVPTAMFAIGTGRMFYLTVYPIADKITNVQWFGGSLSLYLTFFIIYFVGCIAAVVANFFEIRKVAKEEQDKVAIAE